MLNRILDILCQTCDIEYKIPYLMYQKSVMIYLIYHVKYLIYFIIYLLKFIYVIY